MAACPKCGSFLVMGSACEFCARYGRPQQPPPPPQWQPTKYPPPQYPPPQHPPAQYAPATGYSGGQAPVNAEMSPLELASAQRKVLWAGMLIAGIGGLTLAAYLTWGLLIPGGAFLISLLPLDWSKLLYQGILYLVLAVLIWRRSMIALAIATLLFLADSAIYTYRGLPLMSGLSLSLLGYWPWSTIVPTAVRVAILWTVLASFKGMALVRFDHKQRKAAA